MYITPSLKVGIKPTTYYIQNQGGNRNHDPRARRGNTANYAKGPQFKSKVAKILEIFSALSVQLISSMFSSSRSQNATKR